MGNPARFRHRISFFNTDGGKDELGQQVEREEPELIKTVWADIKTMKGTEFFAAASVQAERTYRFIIRFTGEIRHHMYIDYKGRIFDIIEPPINDDELNKTLTIIAKERV